MTEGLVSGDVPELDRKYARMMADVMLSRSADSFPMTSVTRCWFMIAFCRLVFALARNERSELRGALILIVGAVVYLVRDDS